MTELEKLQRAKKYIDKLANGINPLTDTEMTEDKTLNEVRISRCLFYVSEVLSRVIDNGGEVVRKVYVKQAPFTITPEQLAQVEISEQPVGVSIIAKRISAVVGDGTKSLPATHISNWLLQKGYLSENVYSGRKEKVANSNGEALGIITVDSVSSDGRPYRKNIYNADAQRFIISNIIEIEKEIAGE